MKRNERGQSITEYLLVVAAIIVALVAVMPQIQAAARTMMNRSGTSLTNAANAIP